MDSEHTLSKYLLVKEQLSLFLIHILMVRLRNGLNVLERIEYWGFYSFEIVKKEDEMLIGCVGLRVSKSENQAELAYWAGRPYWGKVTHQKRRKRKLNLVLKGRA